jgi:hypothetical protein
MLPFPLRGNFEYTRCERPDGSSYGTGGTCRKGVPKELDPAAVKKQISKLRKEIKEAEEAARTLTSSGKHTSYAKHWENRAQAKREELDSLQEALNTAKNEKDRSVKPKVKKPEFNSLNEKEKSILVNYTTGEYESMLNTNWKLRGLDKGPLTQTEKEEVSIMDTALSKLPRNTNGTTMYRGLDLEEDVAIKLIREAQKTGKITDKGFGSFSSDKSQAEMFATATGGVPVIIVSKHPDFRDVSRFAPEEYQNQLEHVLPRNTSLVVKEVKKDSEGTFYIYTDP